MSPPTTPSLPTPASWTATGEMAVKILKGESNVSDMPIEYTDVTKKYNKTICDDLGLTVPEGYEEIEA